MKLVLAIATLVVLVAVAVAGPEGYLSLDSQHSATIEIDGKRVGRTPLLKLKLSVGRHVVRAQRDNGDSQRFEVTITSGATLEYRLDWDTRGPVDANGYLSITSTPPARIWIDHIDTGLTTPIDAMPVKPGRHKVTFTVAGDRFTYAITIVAGETTTMTKTF